MDSGCSQHIRESAQPGQKTRKIPPGQVLFECVGGIQEGNFLAEVDFGELGTSWAYIIPNSPDCDSLGQHLRESRERVIFLWATDEFDSPLLGYHADCEEEFEALFAKLRKCQALPLAVRGNVPVVESSARIAASAKEARSIIDLDRRVQGYLHGSNRQVTSITKSSVLKNDRTEHQSAAAPSKEALSHSLTHLPADPDNCEICRRAKLKKKPAYRQYVKDPQDDSAQASCEGKRVPLNRYTTRASQYNELKSIDILDPGSEDCSGNRYIVTTLDDYAKWGNAHGTHTKGAADTAEALIDDAREGDGFSQRYRSDNGNEWKGEFDNELRRRVIACDKALPYRSSTNSRHERLHGTINPAVRASLLQSGLPYEFYMLATRHFLFNYNRTHIVRDGKTPHELRYGRTHSPTHKLLPFGCLVDYYLRDEERRKFDPTSAQGIVVGYCDSEGYQVLNLDALNDPKVIRVNTEYTKDVKASPTVFPLSSLGQEAPLFNSRVIYVPDAHHTCQRCKKLASNDEPSCRACKGVRNNRAPHTNNGTCKLQRCNCQVPLLEDVGPHVEEIEQGGEPGVGLEQIFPNIYNADDALEEAPANLDNHIRGGERQPESPSSTDSVEVPELIPVDIPSPENAVEVQEPPKRKKPRKKRKTEAEKLIEDAARFQSVDVPKPIGIRTGAMAMALAAMSDFAFGARIVDVPQEESYLEYTYPEQQYLPKSVLDAIPGPSLQAISDEERILIGGAALVNDPGLFSAVVEVIQPNDPRWKSKEADEAMQTEITKLRDKFGVADFGKPREKSEVMAEGGDNEFIGFKLILGIKNAEMPKEFWKYKARGCATGNYMTDSDGWQTFEDTTSLSGKPVDMTGARISMIHALSQEDGDVQQADAVSAYCQAELLGNPKWLVIPKSLRHLFPACEGMSQPVCRLNKALYGLVRSGFDWMEFSSSKLLEAGWKRCWEGEQAIFEKYFGKHRVLLVVYVDDFIAAGNKNALPDVWKEVNSLFMMEEPEPLSRFLGVHHQIRDHGYSARGNRLKRLTMAQKEYAQSIVDMYKESVGMPLDKKFRHVSTPMCGESLSMVDDPNSEGRYASEAAKYAGKLLYLCRMTRPDLSTAVCRMSRHLHKWDKFADAILHRIIQYMDHYTEYHLEYIIEENMPWSMLLYVDADHNGDPTTSKSTTGFVMYIISKGGDTRAAITWGSKRQTSTAWSSGEAEVVALAEATRPSIKLQLLCRGIMHGTQEKNVFMDVQCDAEAAIGAVRKGYSSMEYMEKTQRVRLGGLHEMLCEADDVSLNKEPTDTNTADVFTKPLERESFVRHRQGLQVKPMTADIIADQIKDQSA